ncbi:MFS general substrate transporter, partial [Auricularia subglabra TFB-10046 SS5]
WPFARKVAITLLLGLTTMCSAFASSVFSPTSTYISRQYGISQEVSVLGIAIFIAGWIPGPVIWAPISELYGHRIAILLPMFAFICLSAATATAKDIQTIFITRFFAGMMGSSPVTIAGGGIADMFDQKERGSAVVFYALAVTAGPTLGPVIGGAVSQSYLGWRWTEYLTVILAAVVVGAATVYLPETFSSVILTRKARALRLRTGRWALHSHRTSIS